MVVTPDTRQMVCMIQRDPYPPSFGPVLLTAAHRILARHLLLRSSLAHGTPPHIQRSQHDVPGPRPCSDGDDDATAVFIALYGLTEVLDEHLQRLYHVRPGTATQHHTTTASLELALNTWVAGLSGPARAVVRRGHRDRDLSAPGAANLRLAYLSVRLLLQRMELEAERERRGGMGREENEGDGDGDDDDDDNNNNNESSPERAGVLLANRYLRARQTAEDIVMLVQELGPRQLEDFWLPGAAFVSVGTSRSFPLSHSPSPPGLMDSQ